MATKKKAAKKPAKKASPAFSPFQFIKEIQAGNAKFEKMTTAQKRMAVLKDALSLTNTKGVKITHGVYGRFSDTVSDFGSQLNLLALPDLGASCNVCAKGALFCSRVRLGDNSPIDITNEEVENIETINALEGIFTEPELDAIEALFEQGEIEEAYLPTELRTLLNEYLEGKSSEEFGEEFYPDKGDTANGNGAVRLRLILENIIAEKGDVWRGLLRPLILKGKKVRKTK